MRAAAVVMVMEVMMMMEVETGVMDVEKAGTAVARL